VDRVGLGGDWVGSGLVESMWVRTSVVRKRLSERVE
jgi:hypothetical protein